MTELVKTQAQLNSAIKGSCDNLNALGVDAMRNQVERALAPVLCGGRDYHAACANLKGKPQSTQGMAHKMITKQGENAVLTHGASLIAESIQRLTSFNADYDHKAPLFFEIVEAFVGEEFVSKHAEVKETLSLFVETLANKGHFDVLHYCVENFEKDRFGDYPDSVSVELEMKIQSKQLAFVVQIDPTNSSVLSVDKILLNNKTYNPGANQGLDFDLYVLARRMMKFLSRQFAIEYGNAFTLSNRFEAPISPALLESLVTELNANGFKQVAQENSEKPTGEIYVIISPENGFKGIHGEWTTNLCDADLVSKSESEAIMSTKDFSELKARSIPLKDCFIFDLDKKRHSVFNLVIDELAKDGECRESICKMFNLSYYGSDRYVNNDNSHITTNSTSEEIDAASIDLEGSHDLIYEIMTEWEPSTVVDKLNSHFDGKIIFYAIDNEIVMAVLEDDVIDWNSTFDIYR